MRGPFVLPFFLLQRYIKSEKSQIPFGKMLQNTVIPQKSVVQLLHG